jgi:hypothetical protein
MFVGCSSSLVFLTQRTQGFSRGRKGGRAVWYGSKDEDEDEGEWRSCYFVGEDEGFN